jgi:hypothetical protein
LRQAITVSGPGSEARSPDDSSAFKIAQAFREERPRNARRAAMQFVETIRPHEQ